VGSRTARILVVEDNDLLRRQVVRQLEVLGHTVVSAGDGAEALAVLQGPQPFDLLFTDMVMPGGMGGDALAEAATRLRPSLKVLITTGYADYFSEDDGVARRVLTKPYRRAQLAVAIQEILADG
jgi:CheY-like chemotaxis protein